jgi:hypothetical protein
MQIKLDVYLEKNNRNSLHQGRGMNGKTPLKASMAIRKIPLPTLIRSGSTFGGTPTLPAGHEAAI